MKLNPKKTALLTLDLQKGVFGLVPDSERVIPVAAKAVAFARQNQFRIIHVGLGFPRGTQRRAFDLDFRSVVLKDACFDADQEVHGVLTEKIFARQAWVAATDEFIAAQ